MTRAGSSGPAVRAIDDATVVLRRLLSAAEGTPPTADPVGPAGVGVWAEDVLATRGAAALARHAVRREVTIVRSWHGTPPGGERVVVRTAPPLTRSGPTARVRRWLAGGAVVRVAGPAAGGPSLLDALATAAGLDRPIPPAGASVGSGGAVLVRATVRAAPVVLRVARDGAPGDPRGLIGPLRALAAAGVGRVPRLLGSGVVGELAWTVETLLPGSTAQGLTPQLLDDLATFCAALPAGGDVEVPRPSTVATGGLLGAHGAGLREVERVLAAALAGLPGVTAHGDLWSGNLLVEGGRLTGVVDWDGHHRAGVPGTDLLHAVATADRLRRHRSLGAELLAAPWRDPATADGLRAGWALAGFAPSPAVADAVGLAWWARQVTNAVRRAPALADDAHWVERNVSAVLDGWRAVLDLG